VGWKMDRIDAIALFVRVVESGSFSATARELSVGQPAVSKQIAALEARLGAQLLRRTSRSLTLTEAGRDFYESGVHLLGELEAAESRVGRGSVSPSGLVRATVAPVFGRLYIVPRLQEFFARYPQVAVELVVADHLMNLVENGIDVGVANGELTDSSLVAGKVAETSIVTVATEAYLASHGEPATPTDLDGHSCVIYAPDGAPRVWGFNGRYGPISHPPTGPFRTNDADQIRTAVLAGFGLAHTPGWLFAAEIASGSVRKVLTAYEPAKLPIYAVRPGGRFLASKVRVFIDFLAKIFAEEPALRLDPS